jgi:uncharacterized protein YndB with AHSA1/START domain
VDAALYYLAAGSGVEVERSARIAAPPERIWAILADHEAMTEWLPVREVVRRRPGEGDPNGLGAVRVVRGSGLALEERITGFEPPRRLEYRLLEGAPVRDHRGEVCLEPDGDGTRVRWRVELRPLVPGTGWLLRRLVDRMLRAALRGLDRRACGPED